MARSKKGKSPAHAGQIFGSIVPGRRWRVYLPRRIIWQKWEEIVGGPVASTSWPWYFRDLDTLVIAVSDSIWMQQLSFESRAILERINRLLPEHSRLSRLRFQAADVEQVRALSRPFSLKKEKGTDAKKKTEKAKKEIPPEELELLDEIDDNELKESLLNIFLNLEDNREKN